MELKGFEFLDKAHKGYPSLIYFRFIDGDDEKVTLQRFIDKAGSKYTKKELDNLFEKEYERLPKNDNNKTADYKKKFRLYLKDKIVARKKIKNGTEDFEKILNKIRSFMEEIYKEV